MKIIIIRNNTKKGISVIINPVIGPVVSFVVCINVFRKGLAIKNIVSPVIIPINPIMYADTLCTCPFLFIVYPYYFLLRYEHFAN